MCKVNLKNKSTLSCQVRKLSQKLSRRRLNSKNISATFRVTSILTHSLEMLKVPKKLTRKVMAFSRRMSLMRRFLRKSVDCQKGREQTCLATKQRLRNKRMKRITSITLSYLQAIHSRESTKKVSSDLHKEHQSHPIAMALSPLISPSEDKTRSSTYD